jgi:hypothetical protein
VAWNWLARGVVGLHFAYLAYVAAGGLLAWRWPKTIKLHVTAVAWAVLIIVTRVQCPLTSVQDYLRERSGEHPLAGGFIDVYVRGTLFPAGGQARAQAALGALVLASWTGLLLRSRRHGAPRFSG